MNLSQHFAWADVTRSATADAKGIDNSLPDALRANVAAHAQLLERVRAALCQQAGGDVPIVTSSWYRCPALNWAVRNPRLPWAGQADATGDHPQGLATDFTAPTFGTPYEACRLLAPQVDALAIGQLIFEGTWVHISSRRPHKAINRILTLLPGGGYAAGILKVRL